jgi:hypothetical protein
MPIDSRIVESRTPIFWRMSAGTRKAVIKHRPIGAQTPRGTQIGAERDRMSTERSINFARKADIG